MSRLVRVIHRLILPLLGVLALGLAGCSDNDHLNSASELDEPGYREGEALLKTGRKQEALTAFLKVISKRGDDAPESHLELGLLYLQYINDPLAAIYHFKKYLALRPNSPQAPLVKQRIDAAIREFARTIPAQPLEGQPQRVDLVAALDRLKQENETLKQQLVDARAGRNGLAPTSPDVPTAAVPASDTEPSAPMFSIPSATMPTVRTRQANQSAAREAIPTVRTVATPPPRVAPTRPATSQAIAPAAANSRPVAGRRYTVRPGDSLSKISMQFYGNRTKIHEIFGANRNVMKSETDLKPGMEIKIP
ncbi:MAG TPA: LysM peptidoglycan-binding domain-containing protein [Lacunisphaera sp.]|jgi:tetratricopeptide (TPR) repeat protein